MTKPVRSVKSVRGGERNVLVFSAPPRLAVGAERDNLRVTTVSREFVDVGMAPRVQWDGLLKVGPLPLGDASGRGVERLQSLFGCWKRPYIKAVLLQCLLERVDLRSDDLGLGLAHGVEVAWNDQSGEQPDDHYHDKQFK